MTIFALFSVDNNYDQPQNNLVAWWRSRPDFDTLAKAYGQEGFPCTADDQTLNVVNLWQGTEVVNYAGTAFRMEELEEGVVK